MAERHRERCCIRLFTLQMAKIAKWARLKPWAWIACGLLTPSRRSCSGYLQWLSRCVRKGTIKTWTDTQPGCCITETNDKSELGHHAFWFFCYLKLASLVKAIVTFMCDRHFQVSCMSHFFLYMYCFSLPQLRWFLCKALTIRASARGEVFRRFSLSFVLRFLSIYLIYFGISASDLTVVFFSGFRAPFDMKEPWVVWSVLKHMKKEQQKKSCSVI